MRKDNATVSVNILDKLYQVSCPPEEERALKESAELLDKKMRQIRENGNVIGVERIAVMAALNLANELLQKQDALENSQETKIQNLCEKIDQVLIKHSQIEL